MHPNRSSVRYALAATIILMVATSLAHAQAPRDFIVPLTATVSRSAVAITLQWDSATANSITVYRRAFESATWGSPISVNPQLRSYTDGNVAVGTTYEYRIVREAIAGTTYVTAFGFICTGIDVPVADTRGRVVLIVDATQASALAPELTRLEQDLAGDGWTVVRRDVSRTASVPDVKSVIRAAYDIDRANTRALFLFGHVPVPYSGNIAPDGHPDHRGAWPADVYYADMDGVWTDAMLFDNSSGRNRNIIGDGRFDQSTLPSPVELQVGRVDLYGMTAFSDGETELLRRYLDKDHAYRIGNVTVTQRGLIDDNFGLSTGEAFASNGWRNFSSVVGSAYVSDADLLTTLRNETYLFAYGCGPGGYSGASGVASTGDLATSYNGAIFNMLFGSYFGDWDVDNAFLRAPLAAGQGLTNCWVGRPNWYLHQMAIGGTIGYGTRLSQNNAGEYMTRHAQSVHIALMGDPTLRIAPVRPPSNLAATPTKGNTVLLTWTASPEPGATYNVYRATTAGGPYVKLNDAPITSTSFTTKKALLARTTEYMVRAVVLTTTASGSYYNPSQGTFATMYQSIQAMQSINVNVHTARSADIR